MKKLLTVLVIFVYFVPVSIFLAFYQISKQEAQDSAASAVLIVPLLFMLAVCILVIISIIGAVRCVISGNVLPFRTVMIFKLCLIPFYIVNFACWALASVVFHIALVVWPFIPFIIAYTYLTMIGTSAHIIAKLFILKRDKTITAKQLAVHFILQITFSADVIDSIYLTAKQKKIEPELERQ